MSSFRAPAHLLRLLLLCTITAPPTFAQASRPPRHALHFRDSSQVAAVACEIAGTARPRGRPTNCQVVAYQETPTAFILRLRETPLTPTTRLDFPRSEVRLEKDGSGAVLTRSPDQ
jgi:hypothetical protein